MNYRLTVVSPVHIGSGHTLTPLDFALVNGGFAVMNLRKLFHAAPERAGDFASQVAQQSTQFSLTDFLTEAERRDSEFHHYCAALNSSSVTVLREEFGQNDAVDVAEALKTPLEHQNYIPGSSLKGAFRTAFAYAVFRDDEKLFQSLKERLEHVDWRCSNEAVNDLLFRGGRLSSHVDLFRAFRVSDSLSVAATPETLAIGTLRILSLYEPRTQERPRQGTMFKQLDAIRHNLPTRERSPLKSGWTFVEVLPTGSAFQGSLDLDERLLQHESANIRHQQYLSYDALIKAANTFALDVCQWELKFFETQVHGIDVAPIVGFYRNLHTRISQADSRHCFLCVGYGGGWHNFTIGMLAEKASDVNFRKLRKELRLAPNRLQFPYPKSRKLLMASTEKIEAPPGWIRLECS